MATEADYIARARPAILGVLAAELAVVKPEMVARLAEGDYAGSDRNFDQHIVGRALDDLVRAGHVVISRATTRGGRVIATYQPTSEAGRGDGIARAAARKRLLYGRYLGWAEGTKRTPMGIIGSAGERAVREAIVQSGTMIPASSGAGEVSTILGAHLPGAADSGGHILAPDQAGNPAEIVTTLVEVKNVRDWIYPRSERIYQVLHKSAIVQQAHPQRHVVPILVCRASAKVTFYMARMLGFFVIDMRTQYVRRLPDDARLDEVRNELHFRDLKTVTGPDPVVLTRLPKLVPHVVRFADTWKQTALDPETADLLGQLSTKNIPSDVRDELLNSLRDRTRERLRIQNLGW